MANNKFCCPHCGGKQPLRKLFFGIVDPMPCVHCGTVIRLKRGYIARFLHLLLIVLSLMSIKPLEKALMSYFQLPEWADLIVFFTLLTLAVFLLQYISYSFSTFERVTDSPQQ